MSHDGRALDAPDGVEGISSSPPGGRRWSALRSSPLVQLLGYVRPHRGYAALTMIFGAMGFLLSFVYPWIIGSVIDLISQRGAAMALAERRGELTRLTQLAALTGVLHAVVLYCRGHFNVHLGDMVVSDLRRSLFAHLQRLSARFYTRERTGSILSRVLHDVHDATAVIYTGLFVVIFDAAQLAIAFVLLPMISWKLTVACVLVFPLYGVLFFAMNERVRVASERLRAQFSRISGNVAEQLSGQALVKTYTAEEREARRFSEDIDRQHELVVAQSHAGHLVAAAGEVLVHLGTTIVVGYGGWLALTGELTPGELTRFLGYVVILYGPVRRFADLNMTYQSSLSAMRRVFRVFDIAPSVVECAQPVREPPRLGHVRFEGVRFRYSDGSDESRARFDDDDGAPPPVDDGEPSSPWVLDGVSLEVQPGERIAVVGVSGAGKTTLVSLLPRLYDATDGRILIDGIDVRDYSLQALRSAIAIVQQDSFVFTGSIRDNIAYGRPEASDAEIIAAATAAHAHDFISGFPDGYATRLGERGVNLSGGQRQRLSIARALLKDPRILILDEATSSLDSESERIVQSALETLMAGRTCFIIAHRLSTIRNASRILVLEDGQIRESGTHAELIKASGRYAGFIRNQSMVA
ncbi:MAG TPA: ABC transporter ATP-binding protein [Planctomycetota bacterium]|nr:ABC transporter ATP-binding protein [Planctomycetota bacterium]